ncbi:MULTISPECIES: hypothetical protein [Actinosynnema]|uniref:hypothetical protein n=1 Tax=Actinosynnema TaxID=40566 RepID=UPI0020A41CCC|nr:hypothetical protein [Actinosynnema pretiosum]MCP2092694.1 hypothetical protein [Actinosynnema pretiosum]
MRPSPFAVPVQVVGEVGRDQAGRLPVSSPDHQVVSPWFTDDLPTVPILLDPIGTFPAYSRGADSR